MCGFRKLSKMPKSIFYEDLIDKDILF